MNCKRNVCVLSAKQVEQQKSLIYVVISLLWFWICFCFITYLCQHLRVLLLCQLHVTECMSSTRPAID